MPGSLPSYVPPAYQQWVMQAAAGTGLPANVVAAQIEEESGFNPRATSPVGAQGIAQFMPGTYQAVGGQGSAYNPQNALPAYITLMRQLLTQFHGNVSDALAAYNAGPGNLRAGRGYASTILRNAGVPANATAGTTGTTAATPAGATTGTTGASATATGTNTPAGAATAATGAAGGGSTAPAVIADSVEAALTAMVPGVPIGSFIAGIIRSADNMWTDMISPLLSFIPIGLGMAVNLLKILEWIVNPANWVRIIAGIAGTVLLALGIHAVSKASA